MLNHSCAVASDWRPSAQIIARSRGLCLLTYTVGARGIGSYGEFGEK